MVNQHKNNESLLKDFELLQQDYIALKASFQKETVELKLLNAYMEEKITNTEAIFESSPVPMFIIDSTTNIVMINHAAVKLSGGNESDLLQHRPGNALRCMHSSKDPRGCGHSKDCKTCVVRNGVESIIANGGTISGAEVEMQLNRNGAIGRVWMNVGVEPLVKEGKQLWCIAMNDITEQKRTEHQLKESQALLRSIIDSTTDMIWSVDIQHFGLLTYNQAFADFFLKSLNVQIVKGMKPEEMLPTPDSLRYWHQIYLQGLKGVPFEVEYPMLTHHHILKLSINPLFHDDVLAGLSVFGKDITIEKQAEEKIRLSEEKFRAAFMTIKDGFYIGTLEDGKIIDVNSGFEAIFQFAPEESIGKTSSELGLWTIPEERDLLVSQLKEKGYCNNLESIGRKKNGELVHVSLTASILTINQAPHIVGVIRDITKSKQAEVSLIESEIRFRELLENSQDASYKRNILTNNYDYLSPVFFQIAGYFQEEMNSLSIEEVTKMMHPDDLPEINRVLSMALSGLHENVFQVEYRFKHKNDNQYRWLLDKFTVMYDVLGKPIALIGSVSDITKAKQAEKELIVETKKTEQSEYRLKLATASGQLGIWDWNLTENTMIWDERMFELYGITPNAFPNNIDAWTNGLHPEDKQRALEECNAALNGIVEFNTTFRILRPDGKVLHLKGDGSIIRDAQGKPLRMIGINRDITEARIAEEQLVMAKDKAEESDRLKSAFLANMSHEIRTPLNGIIGFSELLNDPDFDQNQKNEFTKAIIENGNQLLVIINDIMDLSMLEARQMKIRKKQFKIIELFADLKNEFNGKIGAKGLKFKINILPVDADRVVKNDYYRIRQIFNNLIGNALKFTSSGNIEIGFLPLQAGIEFFVKDTGIGIAREFHEDIFERFRQVDESKTRKYGGNGLGLAISKNLVEMLGGTLRVESEVGKGSTFIFAFPDSVNNTPFTEG